MKTTPKQMALDMERIQIAKDRPTDTAIGIILAGFVMALIALAGLLMDAYIAGLI